MSVWFAIFIACFVSFLGGLVVEDQWEIGRKAWFEIFGKGDDVEDDEQQVEETTVTVAFPKWLGWFMFLTGLVSIVSVLAAGLSWESQRKSDDRFDTFQVCQAKHDRKFEKIFLARSEDSLAVQDALHSFMNTLPAILQSNPPAHAIIDLTQSLDDYLTLYSRQQTFISHHPYKSLPDDCGPVEEK